MTETPIPSAPRRRPLRVTLLTFAALLLAGWGALRFGEAIAFWPVLREYGARPTPLYLAISGGVWLLTGLALAAGLWLGKNWAWYAALAAAAGCGLWYWCDRLFLQQPRANWPFALGVTLAALLSVFLILFSRSTLSFFQVQRTPHEPQ